MQWRFQTGISLYRAIWHLFRLSSSCFSGCDDVYLVFRSKPDPCMVNLEHQSIIDSSLVFTPPVHAPEKDVSGEGSCFYVLLCTVATKESIATRLKCAFATIETPNPDGSLSVAGVSASKMDRNAFLLCKQYYTRWPTLPGSPSASYACSPTSSRWPGR